MANRALSAHAEKVYDDKVEANKANAENIEKNKFLKDFAKPLNMRSGEIYNVTFLHDHDTFLSLQLHQEYDLRTKKSYLTLCNKTYQQADPSFPNCSVCGTVNGERIAYPFLAKLAIGYVHTYEGQVFHNEKNGKDYPFNPIRVIVMRAGKSKVNFQSIDSLARKNAFKPGRFVFEIKKTGEGTDTVYHAPVLVPAEMLGDEFDPASAGAKEALAKYSTKDVDALWQEILVNCQNVNWEIFDIEEPKAPEEDATPTEEPAAGPKQAKAKNQLND